MHDACQVFLFDTKTCHICGEPQLCTNENTDRFIRTVRFIINIPADNVLWSVGLSVWRLGSWSEIPPVASGIVFFLSGLVNVYSTPFNFGAI